MESNHIYVDKTRIIYKLIEQPAAILIIGPRRSGKTLLLSTIEAMFTKKIDWWMNNCPDLYIVQETSKFFNENPYPILNFEFNQCSDDENFKLKIISSLNYAIEKYKLLIEKIPENIEWNNLIENKFNDIIIKLKQKFNDKNPVILIDECDQPIINQMFHENICETQRKVNIEKTIDNFKIFYGKLKQMLIKNLRSVVIVGHSNISQSSIYSCKI